MDAEHSLNDKIQTVLLAINLAVWSLDSFVFRFSTELAGFIPLFISLHIEILSLVTGIYLAVKSEAAVFGKTLVGRIGKPKLTTTGVYARVRHPTYLGFLRALSH